MKRITKGQLVGCIIGLCLLLYPTISNYWNVKHSTMVINNYINKVLSLDNKEYEKILNDVAKYNQDLLTRTNAYSLDADLKKRYNSLLDINNDGIMGYIEIEKLRVALPIYHGTSDDVLQKAIGHLEWSSLPGGGPSTHMVVSGHRGLPNMKLFTDLDDLKLEDVFSINILNETLYYEVDEIKVVNPDVVEDLIIVEGEDYVTLTTCTPYGINTHRLLVRGHRIERKEQPKIVSEAVLVDPVIVATFFAIPFLLILIFIVLFKKPTKKKLEEEIWLKK